MSGGLRLRPVAQELAQVGTGDAIIILMQQTRYLRSPNGTLNKLTGYRPGEACPSFDFVDKLYKVLDEHGIDWFLYFVGDSPTHDEKAKAAFDTLKSIDNRVPRPFAENGRPCPENSACDTATRSRTGGWTLLSVIGYDAQLLGFWRETLLAGNPGAVLTFNYYGCMDEYGVRFD